MLHVLLVLLHCAILWQDRKPLTIEELDVAMLHVLLVLLHCASGVSIRCKADISLSTRSSVIIEMDDHVNRVRHGAEPLRDLVLGDSERQAPHMDAEHAASAPGPAATHAAPHVR